MLKKIGLLFIAFVFMLSAVISASASAADGISHEDTPLNSVFTKGKSINIEQGWEIMYFNDFDIPDEQPDEDFPNIYRPYGLMGLEGGFPYSYVILRKYDRETERNAYKLLNVNDLTFYDGGRILEYASYIEGVDAFVIPLENGRAGILKGNGTLLNESGWDHIKPYFTEERYLVGVVEESLLDVYNVNWHFIDKDGNTVSDEFKEAFVFWNGFATVQKKNGSWTFLKPDGTFIGSGEWQDVTEFNGSFGGVQLGSGLWTFIRSDGTLLNETGWTEIGGFTNEFGLVRLSEDKSTYIKPDGTYLNQDGWSEITAFSGGFGVVKLEDGKKTFVRPDGTLLSETGWSDASGFTHGLAAVTLESGFETFIRPDGTYLNQKGWPAVYDFFGGFAPVKLGSGKQTFIRPDGTLLNETGWAGVGLFIYNGYGLVYDENGMVSLIDGEGTVSPEKYKGMAMDDCTGYLYWMDFDETRLLKTRLFDPKTREDLIPEETDIDNLINPKFCLSFTYADNDASISQFFLKNTDAAVKGFSIDGVNAAINGTDIMLTLPAGTDLSVQTPQILLSYGSDIDKTGVQDFSGPVKYTVTAEDGVTKTTYTVKVTLEKAGSSPDSGESNPPTGDSSMPAVVYIAFMASALVLAAAAIRLKKSRA